MNPENDTQKAYHEIEECNHNWICEGIIDTERDYYGLKELVEYKCYICQAIEQNWERE